MPKVFVSGSQETFACDKGASVFSACGDLHIDSPCNGKATCGKCRIKIISGEVSAVSETEMLFLTKRELEAGVRLACLTVPVSDLTIEPIRKESGHKVLTSGYLPDFEYCPDTSKNCVSIPAAAIETQEPYEEILKRVFALGDDWDIDGLIPIVEGEATGIFFRDRLTAIEKGDTRGRLFGAAIDIGTTTLACSLTDMNTGNEVATVSMLNPQKQYGLDVLSRISYEIENGKDAVAELQESITGAINDMLYEASQSAKISPEQIYEITVAANSTMLHMLLGVDARKLGKAPFAPVFTSPKTLQASSIGINAAPGAVLYCLPGVSSYIGADIVAGAYVCELDKAAGNIIFIDIGTNGEIVLSKKGQLFCCSCAAGPAFEGMNISAGMRAASGAIESIAIHESGVECGVIGNVTPAGICGSGIVSAVSELIRTGIVGKDGAFIKKDRLADDDYRQKLIRLNGTKREFIVADTNPAIIITQRDVRHIQLAKGAILSGVYALLNSAGLSVEDLDGAVIAGQFGAHLSAESLVGVGIVPKELSGRIKYVGNTSKTGAYMALMSGAVKQELREFSHKMKYVELSETPGYERLFSECLLFPS